MSNNPSDSVQKFVDANEMNIIAEQLKNISINLGEQLEIIQDDIDEIKEKILLLESCQAAEACKSWSVENDYFNSITNYKKIWDIKILEKDQIDNCKKEGTLNEIAAQIEQLNLSGDDLYEVSAVIRGLIMAVEEKLSIYAGDDILSFCKNLNENNTWKQATETLENWMASNEIKLATLDLFNQNRPDRYNQYLKTGQKPIKDTACGLSVYMAAVYWLTGNFLDYKTFGDEAAIGSEQISHESYIDPETGKEIHISDPLYNGLGSSWGRLSEDSQYSDTYGVGSYALTNEDGEIVEPSNLTYENIVDDIKNNNVVATLIQAGYPTIDEGGFNPSENAHFIMLVDYKEETDQIYVYNPHTENTGWQSRDVVEKYIVDCCQLVTSLRTAN